MATDPPAAGSVESERAEFRSRLVAARLLVPTGEPGLWGRSAAFESLALGMSALAGAHGVALAREGGWAPPEAVRFPPVIPRAVLERADYLASFPDLVGSVHSFRGRDTDHAALLADVAQDRDWSARLVPTRVTLCAAVCHAYYPTIAGTVPAGGLRADLFGSCYRNEPSDDPARMQSFRQHEQVYVGSPDGALAHRDLWVSAAEELLRGLGLDVTVAVANDPFFGRAGRLLAAGQRQQELKFELLAVTGSTGEPTAIASSNLHRDHFGVAFGLALADGSPAHTACVGFGVERVALALLRRHGMDIGAWPAEVRRALALG